ncbi:dephospho-CoA kinase [Cokeromyces recurvatus]|uniref:dephospho-CoA kinase n=1 Tax=Cokeromyces recurvatus TaxID=90255 RepID=UPI00221EFC32|nr:dephospho-CoA kinase [Cokeromyces recurvatus]KAI7901302.1 dephospho-CoA kinase [Cokeromyces recurvatus]
MKLIGLTGGIATGKSTVSRLLVEQNIPIIDADKIARDIVEPGRKANQLIRQHFGDDVFLPDGHIDRPKLGQIIFQDPEKRKILNHCTHPYVRLEMLKEAFFYWLKGADMVVFDVPLLIESKLDRFMNTNVVVFCSDILQLQRLRKRDNLSEEQALQRIKAQMPISEKVAKADIVLDNSSNIQQLEIQVKNMIEKLRPSRLTWLFEWAGPPTALILLSVLIKQYTPSLFSVINDCIASLK